MVVNRGPDFSETTGNRGDDIDNDNHKNKDDDGSFNEEPLPHFDTFPGAIKDLISPEQDDPQIDDLNAFSDPTINVFT